METQKKVLLLLTGKLANVDNLIATAVFLKKNYNYKIMPLYIRNIDIFIPPANLMVSALGGGVIGNNLEENDNERIKDLYKKLTLNNIIEPLIIEVGLTNKIVEEYMKQADLLLLNRNQNLSDDTFSILKESYKPILLINEQEFSFNNVLIASDDGPKVNKSVGAFYSLFNNVNNFKIISYTKDVDEHALMEYLSDKKKNVEIKNYENIDEFYENLNKASLLIMGNLTKSYFLEKIAKKGLSIIENTSVPIFIGL
ncbi:hypothetical protein SAMN02745174_01451 [Cetobacterium ceti]|uniref:Universal stress protein family protein n=1 Tax=Cetobacterium ceti TaxID=180163 RepID=A0A1T4N7Y8_9FUSO|nr:hypothetical protein [Cetobacterium ceti]SJZ75245.1 hypothetical protein SAMN02745174_01451 [Cetobacterium ceti]